MVAVGGAFRKFIDGSVESVDLDIGYPVQICEKNPFSQLICNLATWISSLCFLEVKSRTITICCTDLSARVRKTLSFVEKSHPFATWS